MSDFNQPLIDLHLHLDGSISMQSARQLAEIEGVNLPKDDLQLQKLLQVDKNCRDLNEYLTKFDLPCSLIQSKESVSKAVFNLCMELQAEGYIYAEIRFAPQFSCRKGLTQKEVVQSALQGLKDSGFNAQLILCCMRLDKDNKKENLETVSLTKEFLNHGVCACDLAGAEKLFPNEKYTDIFQYARKMGLPFTIHSGEACGPESVRKAVQMGASRIGHGIRSAEDEQIMNLLRSNNIPLEICPTSNIQTCVYKDYAQLPLKRLIEKGINITINSDNRTVSSTTVKNEFDILQKYCNFTEEDISKFLKNSINAAFLDSDKKKKLFEIINSKYKGIHDDYKTDTAKTI